MAAFLAAQRQFAEAEAFARRFEARGGSKAWAANMRGNSAIEQGDYSEALRHHRRVTELAPDLFPVQLAWTEYFLGFQDQALARAAKLHPAISTSIRGDHLGAARQVEQMGSALWQPGYGSGLIETMALARNSEGLTEIYTKEAERAICKYWNLSQTLLFVRPLRLANRQPEAERLLTCIERRVNLHARNSVPALNYTNSILLAAQARTAALRGNGAAALTLMNRAIDFGYRTPHGQGLWAVPELDDLRGAEAYRQTDFRMKQIMERERREALQLAS